MRPSISAMYKWIEYFGDEDIEKQFFVAKKLTRKQKRRVEAQCPRRFWDIRYFRGVYYLLAPCGAVFVTGPNTYVVDVFPLRHE